LQLELIHRAVSVKASVVGQDFKESYLREILNYGHTLGHAVEKDSDYELRHGEAVAIGMCFVAELAAIKLGLSQDLVNKHRTILKALKLPTSYKADAWNQLVATMSLDKKVKQGAIRFVAIDKVANCVRIEDATSDEMRSAYERISQ
jgi:3-dehydroquinate synthase